MVGANLTRFGGPFLFTDVEAESLNVYASRPWQVAWMLADLDRIHWTKVRWVYWPDLKVSREAAIKTRFDPREYARNAKPAAEVLTEYRADLHNPAYRVVWANGLGYDAYIVRNWERECGVPHDDTYLLRSIDTNSLLKAKVKGWKPDISSPEAFLRWQYQGSAWIEKGLKTNQTDVGRARGIEHDYASTHDAGSDTELLYKIFKQLVFELEF